MILKGIVTFFINYIPGEEPKPEILLDLIKKYNSDLLGKLENEGYKIMFVPTVRESSRIEVVNLESEL